jgi:hypothetical protein
MRPQSIYVAVFLVIVVAVPSTSTMSSRILNTNSNNAAILSCSTKESNAIQDNNGSCEPHTSTSDTREDNLTTNDNINMIIDDLHRKYQHQPLFLQAIHEMILSISDLFDKDPIYRRAFAIMTEPERSISFRITWMDDHGQLQVNRGWRIEFNR